MSHPDHHRIDARGPRRGRLALVLCGALLGILVASWAGLAQAAATHKPAAKPIVTSAKNTTLSKTIILNTHGRTLYWLQPETTKHLLCTGMCLKFWFPLTVKSKQTRLVAGKGVHGHLAAFKRPEGALQVTLRGLPLYTFVGDNGKNQSNGEGIHSFGGVWHAVTANTPTPTSTGASPTPPPMTPAPLPGY
jgi:predicted lipoprotein with Yx(FWY)xxD motif